MLNQSIVVVALLRLIFLGIVVNNIMLACCHSFCNMVLLDLHLYIISKDLIAYFIVKVIYYYCLCY